MSDKVIAALSEALEDEYKARATYKAVIEAFGPIRPFINIIEAESRHADALIRQFERLGIQAPEDTWAGNVEAPSSITAACESAIDAEIDNSEMYDRLLGIVDDSIVRNVLLNLKDASQNRHLPAFKRCLGRSRDNND